MLLLHKPWPNKCEPWTMNEKMSDCVFFSIFFSHFALKDFVHCFTNWLLCLNKLLYFIFSICSVCSYSCFFHSFIFIGLFVCSYAWRLYVYVLSNHLTVHLEEKIRKLSSVLEHIFLEFGVQYFQRVIALFLYYLYSLYSKSHSHGWRSEFLFRRHHHHHHHMYRKQWKSIR